MLQNLLIKIKYINKAFKCFTIFFHNKFRLIILHKFFVCTFYRNGHEGLLSFLKLLRYCRYPKAIVISFEGLWKLCIFIKFGGCSSKIEPATPVSILNFSRAWQSIKVSYAFIFSTKRVPIEFNNWWKFRVDISNHLWKIQN